MNGRTFRSSLIRVCTVCTKLSVPILRIFTYVHVIIDLQVVKTGQDVEELADEMQDDQVMYVLARYQSTFDMSDTVKFVYFRW